MSKLKFLIEIEDIRDFSEDEIVQVRAFLQARLEGYYQKPPVFLSGSMSLSYVPEDKKSFRSKINPNGK